MGRLPPAALLALLVFSACPHLAALGTGQQHRMSLQDGQRQRPAPQLHNALERVNVAAAHFLPDPTVRLHVNCTKLKRSGEWSEVRGRAPFLRPGLRRTPG